MSAKRQHGAPWPGLLGDERYERDGAAREERLGAESEELALLTRLCEEMARPRPAPVEDALAALAAPFPLLTRAAAPTREWPRRRVLFVPQRPDLSPGRARVMAALTPEFETIDVLAARLSRSRSTVATALFILHRLGKAERADRRTGHGANRTYYRAVP